MKIRFPYDRNKATQAVIWIISRLGGSVEKLSLNKLVFFADREHIYKYGRPIIGGNYYAMKHGPVPSELYDDVKAAQTNSNAQFFVTGNRITTNSKPDCDYLSESDIEILDEIINKYGKMDPFRLADFSHQTEAWKKNFPDPDFGTSHPMPYEDFFLDSEDDSILELILENQETEDILKA